ncbi:MAG TPA: mechanosensitive ion channel, partial [Epsilonproteobacteria bacterium]|nr:mechanosensitive ion channel [Campylobacterota bacterium]
RRFEIPFGVKYGTKPEVVIKVVLDALKNSGFTDIYTSRRRFSRVIMTGMGDSSVNFELFVWVKGHEILFPKRTASRFLILIYNALYANNIEIPFPQRDLHLRSVDEEVVSAIKSDRKPTMNEQKG